MMNPMIIRASLLMVVLVLIGASVSDVFAKAKPGLIEGQWIVELEAPSTMRFDGRDPFVQLQEGFTAAQSKLQTLRPTAPSVTGQRLDVNHPDVLAYVDVLDQERNDLLGQFQSLVGRSIQPYAVYRHVSNGFAVQMSDEEARLLRQMPGVKSVSPDWVHKRHTDRGPGLIGATTLWGLYPEASFGPNKGEGIVIGIIDSGINWDHSAFSDQPVSSSYEFVNPYPNFLGECSNPQVLCNNKLVGVYNFADEGTLGKDPAEDGHGTHVASTAAGNAASFTLGSTGSHRYNTSGVAPNANIISYKVCYSDHPTDEDLDDSCVGSAIGEALEQAVIDQVDVVNYSIGGPAGNPWSSAAAFLPLWENDIAFVTSAGNSGPTAETVGNPANAPWVMAVGNSTHDRLISNSATVGSKSGIAVVPGGGPEITSDISATATRVDAVSPNNLLACDPLPAGSLSGQIAVIQRGVCTFETKINHAQQAGAIAVLMSNQVGGLPIVMGGVDGTTIPGVMMGKSDGDEVLALLASSSRSATIFSGSEVSIDMDWADNMASSSSRGPAPFVSGIMKPNVVAPGTDILAAYVPNENSVAFLSGTSMASPHVAGSAALLRSIHPTWGVDAVFSALQTTADATRVKTNGEPASMYDRGAGRINVALASRVGLYLPLPASDFQAANPQNGGNPRALNLPGLINDACGLTCSFTRTVKAHRDGDWTVTVDGSANVTVSPTTFSLNEGETQVLSVIAVPNPVAAGSLEEARVILTEAPPPSYATNVTRPTKQYLSVAIGNTKTELPSAVSFDTSSSRGQRGLAIPSLRGLSRAIYVATDLSEMTEVTTSLIQDADRESPYVGTTGVETFLIDATESSFGLYAETTESFAQDIDLFVGFDANGDGVAQASEEVCASTSPDELESCWIEGVGAGRWWIVVQNWNSSVAGASDAVTLRYGVTETTTNPVVFVAGPGMHPGGELTLDVYFDDPSLNVGDLRLGALAIFNGTNNDAEFIASIPFSLTRVASARAQTTILFPDEALPVQLQARSIHDKLVFDVPPQTTRLDVTVVGDAGVTASLRRLDFSELPAYAPDTPPAPSAIVTQGSGSSSGFTMSVNDPQAGRYYVVLDNSFGGDRMVNVTAELIESGAIEPRYALYSPVGREINQGIEFQSAGQPFAVWYSFDDDGVPIFYLGSAADRANSSVWVAPLDRYTRGLDQQLANPAGRMSFTSIDRQTAIFSWRLNGAHGSDLMSADIIPETCVSEGGQQKSYTGHWYSPGRDQGGSTTIMAPGIQIQVRYYYDALGIGRWVQLAAPGAGPEASTLNVIEYRGFCPNCNDSQAPTSQTIGTYSRSYSSESSGQEVLTFQSGPPLNQTFGNSTPIPVEKLSARLNCP